MFPLTGMDLAASSVVSRMFHSFERFCPLQEIQPLDWNLCLVPRCLSRPPFEALKLAADKNLTVPGRHPFYLLLRQPRGLVSCMAFPFVFVTCVIGDPVPSPSFLTSWPIPRILLFMTLGLRSSWSHSWMTLLVVTGMNFYSALSEPFVST